MDPRPTLYLIDACSGSGMLGLAVDLALDFRVRTVAYIEREAHAAAALVARMEDKTLDQAPVWDDINTAGDREFLEVVEGFRPLILCAGYPCQPFSFAGRRAGKNDSRHLWPAISRLLEALKPECVFFENVPGHLRMGFDEVRRDLQGQGYSVAAGLFRADEVGASHKRERLFIVGLRLEDSGGAGTWSGGEAARREAGPSDVRQGEWETGSIWLDPADREVADLKRPRSARCEGEWLRVDRPPLQTSRPALEDEELGHAEGLLGQVRPEPEGQQGEDATSGAGVELADSNEKRREQPSKSIAEEMWWNNARESSSCCEQLAVAGLQEHDGREEHEEGGVREPRSELASPCELMANAEIIDKRKQDDKECSITRGWTWKNACGRSRKLADSIGTGLEIRQGERCDNDKERSSVERNGDLIMEDPARVSGRERADGERVLTEHQEMEDADEEPCGQGDGWEVWDEEEDSGSMPIFAPGPGDSGWATIVEEAPWLAPATESRVRRVADGLADVSHMHELQEDEITDDTKHGTTNGAEEDSGDQVCEMRKKRCETGKTSSRLLEADGCDSTLLQVSSKGRPETWKDYIGQESEMRCLRSCVSTKEIATLRALWIIQMQNRLWSLIGITEMDKERHDKTMRMLRENIHSEEVSDGDMRSILRKQNGMAPTEGCRCMSDRLRLTGNGVVPLQAAYAFVSLIAVIIGDEVK